MKSRDLVLSIVKKHLSEAVDGLSVEAIDPARSMKDLGANSLDIVEVVSSSMRELKVKIPRSELSKLTNIDQLVDLLYRTVSEQAVQKAAP
ncbi:MAG: acyl carrier protein [Polyangiaceae bacterium]|jgi:acyl carrier protein|nr:acyl carrier protein [Polyangiaceae bacterium]MBK8942195.1 acyl carrier protein [Polyangiaceae bacterium]